MKRSKTQINGMSPKDYFTWLLDHTTVIAMDDPHLESFKQLSSEGLIQLRIIPATGCEKFAEHLYTKINTFLKEETEGRVKAVLVEVYEHEKNSASYGQ
jgi:6-pyruvoyltetrahydropterin/6-carboxytetrahydropterin synthase